MRVGIIALIAAAGCLPSVDPFALPGTQGGATPRSQPGTRANASAALHPVRMTLLDGEAIGYATFQSHNQKVVATRYGLFTTHLRTRNDAYTAQTWRLSWSRDGGRTFGTLYEATHATNPPVLEADSRGRLYLVRADFIDGAAYLYRFLPERGFRDPQITRIPEGAAGKYALCLDEKRGQLVLFSHNNRIFLIGLDGSIRHAAVLLKDGPDALLQYPHLFLDARGRLHAAWTTQRHGVYLYWSIHWMVSEDGGRIWEVPGGRPLALPVTADQSGPAVEVSLPDERPVHTWLSSFAVLGGKAHFLYLAQTTPPRQHYVRFDAATGVREADVNPRFGGETIALAGLDGFFALGRRGALYCVGNSGGRLACVVSRDNGRTWRDHAISASTYNLYSIGGARSVTQDGRIVGTFTDQAGSNASADRKSRVWCFQIPDGA